MKISFLCRASKSHKDGLSPIELSVIINGRRKYITLDRRIDSVHFDSKRQCVKGDSGINDYLQILRTKCYNIETEMIKNGMEVTVDTFTDIFKNGFKSNSITILQLLKEHNKQIEKKIERGIITKTTLNKYKVTTEFLASYIKSV